jgi:hypothetical protein
VTSPRRLLARLRGRGDRQFRRDQYELRVASLNALRRYDAEHRTSLALLAADPEKWRP